MKEKEACEHRPVGDEMRCSTESSRRAKVEFKRLQL